MPSESLAPGAWPGLGHALAFLRDKPAFLSRCRDRYGDVVRLAIGGPTWLLNDPADVKHVLVDAARAYEKTTKLTSARGRELSGAGLHTATGERHVQLRRMVQPLFHRAMVEAHEAAVQVETERWLQARQHGEVMDVWPSVLALTQRIMLRALFGHALPADNEAFAAAITTRRRYIEYFFTSNLPAAERWPLPIVWQYRSARQVIDRVLLSEIGKRRNDPAQYAAANDWLSMLVVAAGRDGTRFTDDQVRDEALTLTSTGYETVAAMITWAMHLLAHHPGAQQQVAQSCAADDPLGLRQVLEEAMRLYPPTWLYVRVAAEDNRLPSGSLVRAGEKIYLSPFTMHRHPAWFPLPGHFNPDRFSPAAVQSRPRFAYFPFGGGARQCIGEPFARMEAQQVLRRLLTGWALVPKSPREMPLRPYIVLEPRGALCVQWVARGAR